MYKRTFRLLSKRLLTHISNEQKKQSVSLIMEKLIHTKMWNDAETIALTIAREIELETKPIIEEAWKQGKTVVIPKCYPKNNYEMKFFQFTNVKELENVYLDLYEPTEDISKLIQKNEIDLIVVPGLLFDQRGYRIGYGGGYYDRYLKDFLNNKISIAMEEQVVQFLPYDDYDIPVDAIITDEKIYKTNAGYQS